jgi:hypothetical protein
VVALALTLTTLTMLGTGCDPETTASPVELQFRDGEIIDYPTTTTGGTILVKGGHDNPWEILYNGFDRAPLEYQTAFLGGIDKPLRELVVDELLSDEKVVDQCISSCEQQEMEWNGNISVNELRFEHGAVTTGIGEHEALFWQTEVLAEGTASCECGG